MKYNKLVRDKIPEIIENSGNSCIIKTISGNDLKKALENKLLEETNEFINDNMSIEELADIFEVIDAIIKYNDWNIEEIKKIQEIKRKERGSFNNNIYLISTEIKN